MEPWDIPSLPEWAGPQASVNQSGVRSPGLGEPGWNDPLKKEVATHSSIHAWRIPWTEEPGGLRSIGLQGVRHNLPSTQDSHCFHFTSARSWADMWGYFYAQRIHML